MSDWSCVIGAGPGSEMLWGRIRRRTEFLQYVFACGPLNPRVDDTF